jgi:hypothetical protein
VISHFSGLHFAAVWFLTLSFQAVKHRGLILAGCYGNVRVQPGGKKHSSDWILAWTAHWDARRAEIPRIAAFSPHIRAEHQDVPPCGHAVLLLKFRFSRLGEETLKIMVPLRRFWKISHLMLIAWPDQYACVPIWHTLLVTLSLQSLLHLTHTRYVFSKNFRSELSAEAPRSGVYCAGGAEIPQTAIYFTSEKTIVGRGAAVHPLFPIMIKALSSREGLL